MQYYTNFIGSPALFSDRNKINDIQSAISKLPRFSLFIFREKSFEISKKNDFLHSIIKQIKAKNIRLFIASDNDFYSKSGSYNFHFSDFDLRSNKINLTKILHRKKFCRQVNISYACHSLKDLTIMNRSIKNVIDYVFISPIFITTSHNCRPLSFVARQKILHHCQKTTSALIYALGGINQSNLYQIKKTGFDSFAGIDFWCN